MLHRSRPGRTRKRRPNRSAMPSAPGRVRQALADFIPQTSQCVLHPLLILLELSSYRRRQCVSRRFAQPKIAYDSYAIGVHGQSHDRTRRKRSIANDPRTTLAKLDLFGSTISKAKCREGMWDGQVDPLLGSEWTLNRPLIMP